LSHIPPPPRNRIRRQAAQADRSDRSDRGRPGPAWSGLVRVLHRAQKTVGLTGWIQI